ncbi:hypothetical protein PoB_003436500 [Plakobranchus ocellatus]|uniref:Uncharacterized protein n=1 Tax=Plakobranchus ocellatus TaxID=259542 RepID=A0AAV4ALU9_9GAST|nr:hypothetical protein PoB_003436500 [Plakobranchus ocellatus]
MPQPRKPLTLSDARSVLQLGTVRLWSAAQLSNDERFPHFYISMKPTRQVIIYSLPKSDAVQIFRAERNTRSSWRTERDTVGPRLLPLVFAGNRKKRLRMSYPSAGKWSVTAPVDGPPSPRTKSSGAVIELP